MTKKILTTADFFCGAWGFSEWFRQKWIKVVFGLDMWKPAIETHTLNHPEAKHFHGNILEINTPEKINEIVPDTDILTWSPPCVSFSSSNKSWKADKWLWILLIEAYLRIVLVKKYNGTLKYWLMENVSNSSKFVKDKYTAEELGLPKKYWVLEIPTWEHLLASDYGAPQNRKRYVCGDFPMPEKTHEWKEVLIENVLLRLWKPFTWEKKSRIKDPVYWFEIDSSKLTDHYYDTRVSEHDWKKARRLKEDHGFMGKMDFPERVNRTSRTVMATQSASTREAIIFGAEKDNHWEYKSYRLPTIREIATFMWFPINYLFQGTNEWNKYRLVWNAVCPPLSWALAWAILEQEWLDNKYHKLKNNPKDLLFNLNSEENKIQKKEPLRKIDSKFQQHIPYLKNLSFRVDLTNRKTLDFNKGIDWKVELHHWTWKGMKVETEITEEIISTISKYVDIKTLDKDIKNIQSKWLKSSLLLQERYCNINEDKSFMKPEELLETIKNIVNKHLPEAEYKDYLIKNDFLQIISRGEVPLRQIVGFYILAIIIKELD